MSIEVFEYLNNLKPEEQNALEKIRGQVRFLLPDAEERLSRGVPFFYYQGKRVVGFRSTKTHLSFFIKDGHSMKNLKRDLGNYNHSKTVIRFTPQNALPEDLIKKLVIVRIKEIEKQTLKNT
jgi:uncharacterized protein YdhG (YjbR/CyaY superfamily)